MPRSSPSRPNLEHLRRQARALLRAHHAADPTARQRFARYLSLTDAERVLLAQALFVIAREHGFSSWPALKLHIETLAADRRLAARERRRQTQLRREAETRRVAELAERLVAAVANKNLDALFAALLIGARDIERVRAWLVERDLFSPLVSLLLTGIDDPRPRVRFLAAQAMDHFADQRCAEPLRRLLHDPVPRVRWAALHSLQCEACKLAPLARADDTTELLIALALHDPSAKVRRVASWELGQLCADPRAVEALATLAADADATVRRNAARALKRQGGLCGSIDSDDLTGKVVATGERRVNARGLRGEIQIEGAKDEAGVEGRNAM